MASNDIVTRIIFDDSDAIRGMDNVSSAVANVGDEMQKLKEQTEQLTKVQKNFGDSSSQASKDMIVGLETAVKTQQKLVNELKNTEKQQDKNTDAVEASSKSYSKLGESLNKAAASAVKFTAKLSIAALKAFGVALAGVVTQTEIFKSSMRFATSDINFLSGKMDEFVRRQKSSGGFANFFTNMSVTFKNWYSDMVGQGNETETLFKALEGMTKRMSDLKTRTEEQTKSFIDNSNTIKDTTKSFDERRAATEKLTTNEIDQSKQIVDLLEIQLGFLEDVTEEQNPKIALERNKIQQQLNAEAIKQNNIKLTELQTIKSINAEETTLAELRRKAVEESVAILTEQAKNREERINSLIDEQDVIALNNRQANIDLIEDDEERLDAQVKLDKELTNFKFDEIEKRLKAEGLSTEEFGKLREDALTVLTLKGEQERAIIREKARVPSGGFRVTGEAAKDGGSSSPEDREKEIRKNARQAARSIRAVSNLVDGVLDGITDLTDQAISENERFIDSLRERRDELEDVLSDELALREEGLANNVTGAQKELDALQAQEEAAQLKQEELEKKRTKQQLLQDQLKFVSQIGLAVASLIAAEASKGIIGLVIAATAIPFLFKLIAGAKAQSETLHEGGPVGTAGTPWRSDRYGRGHRVEDSNLVLGGDEFVINGRTTSKHRGFLEQLNAGYFDNMNLAASMNQGFRKRDSTIQQRQGKRNQEMLNRAMSNAMHVHSSEMIQFMAKQGQYYSYTPGDTVVHVTPTQIKSTRK